MDSIIIYVLIAVILALASKVNLLQEKVNHINSNLFKISKQIGVPQNPLDDELKSLVEKGKRIQAIKKLREGTGLGLLEAKNYVDSL